ncbi:hypothetical protein AQUCO_00201415v1 [Aquilegia coerulea]|uniref:Maltose excess protein 1 n=1 Tax=Aquilegia coerulea TaxID=218851 RepID=A0A2G5F7Y8_AQUCA|nr:hypothetical protein AQUCO_00201415v1 [Aquilegia coerulea]
MMTPLAIRSPTTRPLPATTTTSYFQRLKPSTRYHILPFPSHPPNNPSTCNSFHLHNNNNFPLHKHQTIHSHRSNPIPGALESDLPYPEDQQPQGLEKKISSEAVEWDSLTAKFAASANIPFLLLQLPQILLNAQNLMAGNNSALLAVSWLGMLTGLLGNLSLLSYFAKKREKEAILVQTLGVISIYVVIAQLAMAQAMPFYHYLVTSIVVVAGLILNFLNYFNLLNEGIWLFWEDFITVGGLTVLPQVMWSTFVPYIPNSILPGALAFVMAVAVVIMVMFTQFIVYSY